MGLPARWQDPEHGLCLSLYAAIAQLNSAGLRYERNGEALIVFCDGQQPHRVEPVQIKAIGLMYPAVALEGSAR
jgi:hypothetical protein